MPGQTGARALVVLACVFAAFNVPALASGDPPCVLQPGAREVTICSPQDGATSAAPVEVVAWAESESQVRLTQLYVNGSKFWEAPANELDVAVPLDAGTHRLTVQALDDEGWFRRTVHITVGEEKSAEDDPGGVCPAPEAPGIHLCSPQDGDSAGTPVLVRAAAAAPSGVRFMQVWVDGTRYHHENGETLSVPLTLEEGMRRVTVTARDNDDVVHRQVAHVLVGEEAAPGGSCSPPAEGGMRICSLSEGGTYASPVPLAAAASSSSSIRFTQVYINGEKRYEVLADWIDTALEMTPGAHRVVVQARDAEGNLLREVAHIHVAEPETPCARDPEDPSVTLCMPVDGESLASPLRLLATTNSSSAVRYMQVWVDGTRIFHQEAAELDLMLNLEEGERRITVTARNQEDADFRKTAHVTITGGNEESPGDEPAAGLRISPARASVSLGQTVQLAADAEVTWAVESGEGDSESTASISPEGLFTAPQTAGAHTVTATSTADPEAQATATIYVTGFDGVFTHHNDPERTGQNQHERVLTPENVNSAGFGKLFSYPVDGYVFAQPLYVAGVDIAGVGRRNVVYVATQHNSVYAFDAEGRSSEPYWHASFIDAESGIVPMSSADVQTSNSGPEVGITGTPVIDPQTKTLYVVAATNENGVYYQRLHALDIRSGEARPGSGVEIRPVIIGEGYDADAEGRIVFLPERQNQRPALLLLDGVVYAGWGSHHVIHPWHGWLMGFDATTLQPVSVLNVTPDTSRGGIWHGGGGPAADEHGYIYVGTGQGNFTAHEGGRDYGNSLLKLIPAGGDLQVVDYFTPFDQLRMLSHDMDLGSSGPLVLPEQPGAAHPRLVLVANKDGNIYLMSRDNLGGHNVNDDTQIVQVLYGVVGPVRGTPAYWNGHIYFAGAQDVLQAYALKDGLLSGAPVARGTAVLESRGAVPVVSADGDGDGIVWLVNRRPNLPGVLYAHDATDISRELYNSEQFPIRDSMGRGTKFSVPTVAHGRVYVGTQSELVVFGLLE